MTASRTVGEVASLALASIGPEAVRALADAIGHAVRDPLVGHVSRSQTPTGHVPRHPRPSRGRSRSRSSRSQTPTVLSGCCQTPIVRSRSQTPTARSLAFSRSFSRSRSSFAFVAFSDTHLSVRSCSQTPGHVLRGHVLRHPLFGSVLRHLTFARHSAATKSWMPELAISWVSKTVENWVSDIAENWVSHIAPFAQEPPRLDIACVV
jgi:hypothetical protein